MDEPFGPENFWPRSTYLPWGSIIDLGRFGIMGVEVHGFWVLEIDDVRPGGGARPSASWAR